MAKNPIITMKLQDFVSNFPNGRDFLLANLPAGMGMHDMLKMFADEKYLVKFDGESLEIGYAEDHWNIEDRHKQQVRKSSVSKKKRKKKR